MNSLTLPGEIPGLLQLGSPVIPVRTTIGTWTVFRIDRNGFSCISDKTDELNNDWAGKQERL